MASETRPFLMTDYYLATERKETSVLVMVWGSCLRRRVFI